MSTFSQRHGLEKPDAPISVRSEAPTWLRSIITGVEKIWGYASEQARHVREGQTIDSREAELVVGLAGSLPTYLVKKSSS